MPQLINYLSCDALASEPINLEELKTQARIDLDLTDDDLFIQTVLIPSARQQAETRTGSAIRPARYRQLLTGFPHQSETLWLALGNVQTVESLTYVPHGHLSDQPTGIGRSTFDLSRTDLINLDRQNALVLQHGRWPHAQSGARAVELVMTAGLEPDAIAQTFPSVKMWMLMAAAWGYAQREMFLLQTRGSGYQELPSDFMQVLLDPMKLPPRW